MTSLGMTLVPECEHQAEADEDQGEIDGGEGGDEVDGTGAQRETRSEPITSCRG